MYVKYYHLSLRSLRRSQNLSERAFSEKAGISRITLRQLEGGIGNPTVGTLVTVGNQLGRELLIEFVPREECHSEFSTVALSLKVAQSEVSSWKIHFMELVDTFRKTRDPRLLLLPPVPQLERRLTALLASIVVALCNEVGQTAPGWAQKPYFLETPWFVSEMESLKALALRDSPLAFRRNNIFVQDNFLERV